MIMLIRLLLSLFRGGAGHAHEHDAYPSGLRGVFLPIGVAVIALVYLVFASAPPDDPAGGFHLHQFGQLPIIDKGSGRIKPIESAFRTKLMLISTRQVFYDEGKNEHSAVEWGLDALTSSKPFTNAAAYEAKVFRIENDQVLSLLKLERRPGSYRYSLEEIGRQWPQFVDAVGRVEDKKEDERDLFDTKLAELADHVSVYRALADRETPLLLNPADPKNPQPLGLVLHDWAVAADDAQKAGRPTPTPTPFLVMLTAYAHDRPDEFNKALDAYQAQLETAMPAETHRTGVEVAFDDFAPFYQCAILYVCVLALTSLGWFAFSQADFSPFWSQWAKPLNRSAFVLGGITLLVHTGALITRMYLMNRPFVFVTNLYGTAIFIGWVAALFGFGLEGLYRNGIGNFVTGTAGFITMIIAQFLAMGDDTMEMMRAVLDTNLWLATHVTSVNIGYAATMAAGLLGALFILRGLFTRSLGGEAVRSFGNAVYAAVCFATLFSFTGTVLGGIWADQSWGRFWGWDPKENGALLIVVWNALILHARWGGLVKQRGMAVLTLMGNIIVIWSWWGVNMLGVGLHAYANTDPGMLYSVLGAVFAHLVLIGVGLVPKQYWRSFAVETGVDAPPPAQPPANGRRAGRGSPHIGPAPA